MRDVFAEDGERLPKCKRLESQDKFYASALRNAPDERQIAAQLLFFKDVAGRGMIRVGICVHSFEMRKERGEMGKERWEMRKEKGEMPCG